MDKIYTIILAAGKGTRMNTGGSKLLQKVHGKSMIKRVVETAESSKSNEIITVLGYKSEEVEKELKEYKVKFVYQKEQLGTGHAVMQAIPELKDGIVVILYGDVPLIKKETIDDLINVHIKNNASATILTANFANPFGYGRIIKNDEGKVVDIVEEIECDKIQRNIKEINVGIYCFDVDKLKYALSRIKNDNTKQEYYLTDTIKILAPDNNIITLNTNKTTELLGVNDRVQLELVNRIYKNRKNIEYMKNGVTIFDINNTYIYDDVQIGKDSIIYPGVVIESGSKIGNDCIIGHNAYIKEKARIKRETIIKPNTFVKR